MNLENCALMLVEDIRCFYIVRKSERKILNNIGITPREFSCRGTGVNLM